MSKISQANKKRREKLYDDFFKKEYHEISDYFEIEEFPNKFCKIYTKEYGAIDYYPMSDKICLGKDKGWRIDGLWWIKTNLLKHL